MKIGHKLSLGFIGLTLLIAVTGYFSLRTSQATLENAIGNSSADFAEQVISNINRKIQRRIEDIQALATNAQFKDLAVRSNASFEKMSNPGDYIVQVDNEWNKECNEIKPVMAELQNNPSSRRLQTLRTFYNTKYGFPVFSEIFITNRFGANIAQSNKTSDYNQADEDWWQIAKKDGLYISQVEFDESSNTYCVELASCINDQNGEFLGVIKGILSIQETINVINEAKTASNYKTMQLHLLDKNGKTIYSTSDALPTDIVNLFISRAGDTQQQNYPYHIEKDNKTNETLYSCAYSKSYDDFKGLNWTIITETGAAEIFAPLIRLKHTILLTGLAFFAMALLASTLTYRSIVVPVAALKTATVQIAAGNLNTNLAATSSDEIGQLAHSFQQMTLQLKKTIAALNDEISQRSKSEEKLKNNQRFLDSIFDSFQAGIGIMDRDLNILKANNWMEKAYKDIMPLVGKKCYKAYHHRDSICDGCPAILTEKTGQPHCTIISNPSSELKADWIELSTFPLKDQNGNITGIIEYASDVTERVNAEKSLRESEAHLRTILDNILTGIFIIDPDTHTIVYANPIAAQLTGKTREQLVGSICHDHICPAQRGSCPITDLKQQIDNSERILLTANGEKRQVIKTAVTVILDEKPHLLESFVDITEQKKTEQLTEKLNKDLEITVTELSRSNRQLQDFVHIAAHDLKTPVRGIGTLADWLISDYGGKLDEHGREQIHLLKLRVTRINKLIDGMLLFSKIVRTGSREKLVDMNTLLNQIIKELHVPKNIETAVDSLPSIYCENEHIEQVFLNLLSNAIAFMDKPNGLIKVGCVTQGNFWKFYVSDNGPGIEQRHFERIFGIFQTLPRKQEPETAGIGLAVVRKIVELYGGKIWVESQPGKGSTFFFTFPQTGRTEQASENIFAATTEHGNKKNV